MVRAAALAASPPPALTATLVGLTGPPFCSVKEAVADPLPSMTSELSETGAAGPVTATLDVDGGAIARSRRQRAMRCLQRS